MLSRRDSLICACVMVVISCHMTHVTSYSISLSEFLGRENPPYSTGDIIDDVIHKNSLKASLDRLQPLVEQFENRPIEEDEPNAAWNGQADWSAATGSEDEQTLEQPAMAASPNDPSIRKRYYRKNRYCNLNNINARAFFEFLRTGRICGKRLSHMRFGLTGR